MPFKPGQSGNPSGARVKSEEQRQFEAKCREWCRLFAFDKLKRAVDSRDPKRQDWAVEAMLNRAFGKPVETSVIDASITAETGSGAEELAREAAALIGTGKVGGGEAAGPGPVDS